MVYVENPLCTVPDDKGNGTSAGVTQTGKAMPRKSISYCHQPARKIRFQAA